MLKKIKLVLEKMKSIGYNIIRGANKPTGNTIDLFDKSIAITHWAIAKR